MRWLGLIALVASACSFSPGVLPIDAATDGPPPISVGFAKADTLADEESGLVPIRVVLSKPADEAISVTYAITGGTATQTVDYTGGNGTLTFAPGDVEETIDITIGPDGMEEPDETILLALQSVSGAGAGLVNKDHTVTISANVLPRVTFTMGTSSDAESVSPVVDVMLTKASLLTTSVQISIVTSTATSGGVDYDVSATTVTFPPNITTQSITLNVNDDALDEDSEDAVIALTTPVNLLLGTTPMHTHTITDDDDPPTVSFVGSASSIGEAGVMATLVVQLSALSGKTVTVPFSVDAASTAGNTDFALATTSPLTFAPGTQMMNIQVNITQDTALEPPETVVLGFGTLVNATAGTNPSYTLTIIDDDQTCLGAGSYLACYPTPSTDVAVPGGTFNTDTDALCAATQPTGWTGQPASCFVVGQNISVTGLVVVGSRPLVLFASGDISVTTTIDAASHRGISTGPGAAGQVCAAFTRGASNSTTGAGGGAGGTFRSKGGDGGIGDGTANTNGLAPAPDAQPTVLRAGCPGQNGGKGNATGGNNAGVGGFGGGALYLVAGGTISIGNLVTINVSGAGATAQTSPDGGAFAGGGGGGSGGMLKLFSQTMSVSGARLIANGGGGSSGADSNTAGASGSDPLATTVTAPGIGGSVSSAGGDGGDGWGGTTPAESGGGGSSGKGGGGGGGGGGFIESNLPLTGAQVSAGQVVP